jgi:hypothetical protein
MINLLREKPVAFVVIVIGLIFYQGLLASTQVSNVFNGCEQKTNSHLIKMLNQKIKSMDPLQAKAYVRAYAQALAQVHLCAYQQSHKV